MGLKSNNFEFTSENPWCTGPSHGLSIVQEVQYIICPKTHQLRFNGVGESLRSKEKAGNQNDWRSKEQNPEQTAETGTAETLLWQRGSLESSLGVNGFQKGQWRWGNEVKLLKYQQQQSQVSQRADSCGEWNAGPQPKWDVKSLL